MRQVQDGSLALPELRLWQNVADWLQTRRLLGVSVAMWDGKRLNKWLQDDIYHDTRSAEEIIEAVGRAHEARRRGSGV